MNGPTSSGPRVWLKSNGLECLFRLAAVACLSRFLVQAWTAYEHTQNFAILLQAASEFLTIALIVVARLPIIRSTHWLDVAATLVGTYFFLFFADLETGAPLLPAPYPALIQVLGLLLQLWAKATLGRSFGLLPANRGIVQSGPFRWIRHPIYLSYLITHLGFLLAVFSWHNLAMLTLLYGFQALRTIREERVLNLDPDYAAYCTRVRWRWVPGLF